MTQRKSFEASFDTVQEEMIKVRRARQKADEAKAAWRTAEAAFQMAVKAAKAAVLAAKKDEARR